MFFFLIHSIKQRSEFDCDNERWAFARTLIVNSRTNVCCHLPLSWSDNKRDRKYPINSESTEKYRRTAYHPPRNIMVIHWGWAYDGVNASIPRNTGPECVQYLSPRRHLIESAVLLPSMLVLLKYSLSKIRPITIDYGPLNRVCAGKQTLLVMMSALLGLEMGFKLCTRTAIYILNPCHITSMVQVYLLAAKPSKLTTAVFRIHLNYLNGPLLAFLFPEHDSRRITFELPTYYVQHGLMFVIAAYLLRSGGEFNRIHIQKLCPASSINVIQYLFSFKFYAGAYTVEKISDLSWNLLAYAIFIIYHFGILEYFAVVCTEYRIYYPCWLQKKNAFSRNYSTHLQSHAILFSFTYIYSQPM